MANYNDNTFKVNDVNVFAGNNAGAANTDSPIFEDSTGGYANVGVGADALEKNKRGWRNTAVGFKALANNTEGHYNTAIGDNALEFNIGQKVDGSQDPGARNTAVGSYALRYNTVGRGNVAMGRDAAHSNETGNYNTAIGTNAYSGTVTEGGQQDRKKASYNTAIGYNALFNTDADRNVGLGAWAGYDNKDGINNVIIGVNANRKSTASNRNVSVGNEVMSSMTSGLDNTAIGTEALTNLKTGNSNTAVGDLALAYDISGNPLTSITDSVGLGKQSRASGDKQVQLGRSGTTTYAYGAVQNRSDIRDKADVRDTELGLDFIKKLRPVDFKWDYREDYSEIQEDGSIVKHEKDGSKKGKRFHHGLIAQEVQEVIEETGKDFGGFQDHSVSGGSDVLSLGYEELIAPLIKAVQELSAELAEVKKAKK